MKSNLCYKCSLKWYISMSIKLIIMLLLILTNYGEMKEYRDFNGHSPNNIINSPFNSDYILSC